MRKPAALPILLLLPLLVVVAACATSTGPAPAAAPAAVAAADALPHPHPSGARGYDVSELSTSVSACEDFFIYANGGWMERNPVPPAYSRWGRFDELRERNLEHVRDILVEAANAGAPAGSNVRRIGDYWNSCMDEKAVERAGVTPLAADLALIEALANTSGVPAVVARLHERGSGALFLFHATQDAKKSTDVIAEVFQGGLGLPDRDYYLEQDPKSKETRDKYVAHVARMFELAGDPAHRAGAAAATVMEIETALARASMTRVEMRDPNGLYNPRTLDALAAASPQFDWRAYLRETGAPPLATVNVAQPLFAAEVNRLLAARPIAEWKTYFRWHLLADAAPTLSQAFVEEDFAFNGTVLSGRKELLPRWKRCVRSTDGLLGEAIGAEYVKRHFPPQAKARMLELISNLTETVNEELGKLPWMGEATRKEAQRKLASFASKIGYPDTWRDYSALEVVGGPYAENVARANRFEFQRDLAKIGKPVDRAEWFMSPPTVNAYYNPALNEIAFPAGILQPPFYDSNADDAVNYGGIGGVIGHEVIHGFDDEGRQYDPEGNLRDWWTAEDAAHFEEKAACVEQQFDAYKVGDLNVNGKLVLGESIADLAGLTMAYRAHQRAMAKNGRPGSIDGLTPEQRLFLGWARVWGSNIRDEEARLRVKTDPHAPARYRVNGPISNMPEFAKAFGCKAGDPMVRPDGVRCQIW